jgi:uncharacterized protein YndB with AHSA1/START domain
VTVAIVGGVLLLLTIIGAFLPRYHQVSRSVEIKQTPEILWQTITDYAHVPDWHREIVTVEKLPDRAGREVWRETYKGNYPITLETGATEPPRRLVRHIADEKGPFAGRWEFDLAPTAAGCRVTITEHGDIANPFFRFMARLFMNPATYLDMYLEALAEKFNQEAEIEQK